MNSFLIKVLKFYKSAISPIFVQLFGQACRFTPTCSQYTIEALEKYGTKKGLVLGIKRVARCHPFGGYGFDPVK